MNKLKLHLIDMSKLKESVEVFKVNSLKSEV